MGEKSKSKVLNTFENGMYLDSLHSLQPKGTYREAWGVANKTDEENRFGLVNEASNEIWVAKPKGSVVRALMYIEERNYFIGFLRAASGISEIGIFDEINKRYTKILDDNDLPEPLKFSDAEWNSLTAKVMQPCNQLYLNWSNADYFYRINLDDKCRDWKRKPTRLFREHCASVPVSTIMDGGGGGIPNGIYFPFFRLRDFGGNVTNWFHVGQPIPIGEGYEGDNIAGEISGKAINIKIEDLHEDYGIVDIGIHSIIGGRPLTMWVDTVAYGKGIVDYYYRGPTGKEQPIDLSTVIGRNNLYIRGRSLMQFDSHLLIYNTRANYNIDWQRDVNKFKLYYQIYGVRRSEAHKHKGLRPNENYWIGIHTNWVDNTKSADFSFIGPKPTENRMVRLPGCDCEVPYWEVEDTTRRTKTFCDLSGLINKQQVEHKLTEADDNDLVPEYEPGENGDPVVSNNDKNVDGDKVVEKVNKDVNDAKDGSAAKDLDTLKCMCESFRQVLLDAEALGGGDLEKSTRFVGVNKKELYELACACEAAKEEDGSQIYLPGTFHALIEKIVE